MPFLASCAHIDSTTRVERGPLLRSFERPVLLEGGFTADVRADWPLLKLTVVQYDVCRAQEVEEYAEDHITERSSNASGPTLSMGVSLVLASGILFGVSYLVSAQPDLNTIDRGGRYGASTQQYVQLASGIAGGVGLPALVVALITRARTTDQVVTERAEQITGQKDVRCNERPATGPASLSNAQGVVVPVQVVDGALDIDGRALPMVPDAMRFADRELELDENARVTFTAWAACVALEKEGDKPAQSLSESGLLVRAERLHLCRAVRSDLAAEQKATDDELSQRREKGGPAAWAPGTNVSSFEEAVSAYAPSIRLNATSKDLVVLDAPEAVEGRAVLLQGIVSEGLTENIGVIQLGEREVFLFIPPRKAWGGSFPNGTRVEVVALIAGRQTLGDKTLPLLRAVWMRSGF